MRILPTYTIGLGRVSIVPPALVSAADSRNASPAPMQFREVQESDVAALSALYADAVRVAGPEFYSREQIEAWASYATEPAFRSFVLDPHTLVAFDDSGALGFTGLEPNGHVTALYVRSDRLRQGIATALIRELLAEASVRGFNQLHVEASDFSRPLFERFGFVLESVERSERHGAVFERYLMARASR